MPKDEPDKAGVIIPPHVLQAGPGPEAKVLGCEPGIV